MGSYHGKKSFETFSHRRSCLVRPLLNDESLKARYPPSLVKVRAAGGLSGRLGCRKDEGLTASLCPPHRWRVTEAAALGLPTLRPRPAL